MKDLICMNFWQNSKNQSGLGIIRISFWETMRDYYKVFLWFVTICSDVGKRHDIEYNYFLIHFEIKDPTIKMLMFLFTR